MASGCYNSNCTFSMGRPDCIGKGGSTFFDKLRMSAGEKRSEMLNRNVILGLITILVLMIMMVTMAIMPPFK
jgi:hypothetical protein